MNVMMDQRIIRWSERRKPALVVKIIQGKATVAEASGGSDLSPFEFKGWVEDAKKRVSSWRPAIVSREPGDRF